MAKTIDEIYNDLISVKNGVSELNGLTSPSTTAIWRLIYYTVAVVLSTQQQIFDLFTTEIDNRKKTYKPMTALYWIDRLKNFYQYNVSNDKGVLRVNEDYTFVYEVEDIPSRIIKYAAVSETGRNAFIKIAKDVTGTPTVLTSQELISVQAFVNNIKFAGSYITVSSWTPDSLRINIDVYYDKSLNNIEVENLVVAEIKSYVSNLTFDGKLVILDILLQIRNNVEGVTNIIVNEFYSTPAEDSEIDIMAYADDSYITKAGYAALNEVDSIITMIPV